MKIMVIFLALFMLSSELQAQATGNNIRYIRDELYVPLRSGQGMEYRIIHKGLRSGTKLKLLELSEDGVYARVTTNSGKEGWIQVQYLSEEPAGRELYLKAKKTITQLEASNRELTDNVAKLQDENQALNQQVTQLSDNHEAVSQELSDIKSISANAIQLNNDNSKLLEENQVLKNQVDVLTTDKKRLQDKLSNSNFLDGAYAVLIGVIITLLVPRLWPKKKDTW